MSTRTVNLDAMITRSDFASEHGQASQSSDKFEKIALKDLVGESAILNKLLRKPDFQRETTQWKPAQIAMLIESFLDSELIPAVILWQSNSHIFVIDGGHRLSALLAWANDDYGDGPHSLAFFKGELTQAQKRLAEKTRREINKLVGTYQHFAQKLQHNNDEDSISDGRLVTFATRGIQVQWIIGDADKAESSFFKINTQGSALDPVEEKILKNRRKAPAIAARSIARAATGHKYWSKFTEDIQKEIASKSAAIHSALFSPEIQTPIKSMQLPLGGSGSTTNMLDILMQLSSIVDPEQRTLTDYNDDISGQETINLLGHFEKTVDRLVGNKSQSLGLHPFIYFYTANGRHSPPLMLAMFSIISNRIKDNNKTWFRKFTQNRSKIEKTIINNKNILSLLISAQGSKLRVKSTIAALECIFQNAISDVEETTADQLAKAMGLESRFYNIQSKPTQGFSDDTKSSAFIKQAFAQSIHCPICEGYLDIEKSASYDHIIRKQDGGDGREENCQLTHPYCNSGFKN